MDIKLFWGIFSAIFTLIIFIPYFRDIYRKNTEPHLYSWLIWTILQGTGAAAIFKGGAGNGAWALVAGTSVCFSVFALSFKYGTKNIKRFDLYCLVGALLALAVYFFVSNPLYSIFLVAPIDFIAYFPTFRKSFEEPYTETLITWFLSAGANLLSIFAIQHYSLTTAFYQTTLVATNLTLCVVIIVRRRVISKRQ